MCVSKLAAQYASNQLYYDFIYYFIRRLELIKIYFSDIIILKYLQIAQVLFSDVDIKKSFSYLIFFKNIFENIRVIIKVELCIRYYIRDFKRYKDTESIIY